jgi:hypothetical protein
VPRNAKALKGPAAASEGIDIASLGSSKVVTAASVGRATIIQPGDRKWVTTIECINVLQPRAT